MRTSIRRSRLPSAPPCVLNDEVLPEGGPIHELFERWARRTPHAVAVTSDTGSSLTYKQLNDRAERLARCLLERGIGPESRVGVALGHEVTLLVGILGVLKSGAAFVPIDLTQPAERVATILSEADAELTVTEAAAAPGLLAHGCATLLLEEAMKRRFRGPAPRAPRLGGHNLAYVLFTSGTTGKPKGVLTPHRTLVRAFHAWNRVYDLDRGIRCIGQTAAFSFAVFQADWIRTLCSGGKLVLCGTSTVLNPARLLDVFDREGVHFTEMVPGAFRLLARFCEATGRRPESLRTISLGSDRWYMREHRWARGIFAPGTTVIHTFGLTETTIDTAYYLDCDPALPGTELTPIGRPWLNVRMYILDSSLRPVAPGETGELFVGGELVTRGYARQPRLTAERFLPDPWSRHRGGRMYRTGDLARLNGDSQVQFLGRLDHQVKIRGFRVEPGEVEASLEQVAGVRQCLAVALPDETGEARLVAYVLSAPNADLTPEALWERASTTLPGYMVPAAYVILSALPLTRSGKIDRTALRLPTADDVPRLANAQQAGDTDTAFVARVWGELLGLDAVGVDEDFFRIGGHSLLAVQMLARINTAFETDLLLADVFKSPTITQLIDGIRRRRIADPQGPGPTTGASGRNAPLPLSREQARFWLEELARPGGRDYVITMVCALPEETTAETARGALNAVLERHEALRTVFLVEDGQPTQVVKPPSEVPVETVPGGLASAVRGLSRTGFDLGTGPLLKAALVNDSGRTWAVLAIHHIACDGLSLRIVEQDLLALCGARPEERAAKLPPARPYSEYVTWQQRQSAEAALADAQFWVDALEDAPTAPSLPTDFPRREDRAIRGASIGVRLSPSLTQALREFCREQAVTPFVVFGAALGRLLQGLGAVTPVPIAYPVTTRSRPEHARMVGLFVDTQVLLGRPSPHSFVSCVRSIRESLVAGLSHTHASFAEVMAAIRRARGGTAPHVSLLLNVEDAGAGAEQGPARWRSSLGTAKFDWTVTVAPGPDSFRLLWEYDASLFSSATIDRCVDRLLYSLECSLRDAERVMDDISIMPPAELEAWRRLSGLGITQSTGGSPGTVVDRIAARAERAPKAGAVWHAGGTLSYGELWMRSGAVASILVENGANVEARVAVRLPRTADLVVAILGVLRAGCSYVPIDPSYPEARIREMLRDSAARTLLTDVTGLELAAGAGVPGLLVSEAASCPLSAKLPELRPDQLAYVMYTSGSTGRPKGVMIEHHSVAALADWMRWAYDAETLSGVLAVTSVCFDLSVFEILGTLASGGRVVMVDGPLAIGELGPGASARLLNTVPSAAAEVADANHLPRMLRAVNVAGEALTAAAVRRILARAPRVINLYGPTETCVYSTATLVAANDPDPPIGRPLPGETAYLLDRMLRPAPVGAEGEIVIGGSGVGRGYVGRPGATAERFVPDPYSPVPGARMYRTGDRGRWRGDGQLMFLGRADHQVKVRGFRVETGEVEWAVTRAPGVREAAVLVQGRSAEDMRLVAFFVPETGATPEPDAVREHVRALLPAFMVPSLLRSVERLPRTATGKVDRVALSAVANDIDRTPGDPAATSTERWLRTLWAELLGVENLGVEENLASLGATSLLVVRAISRLEREYGVSLSWTEVFQAPTVRELASLVEHRARRPGVHHAGALTALERTRPLALSYAQEGVWLAASRTGGRGFSIGFTVPVPADLPPAVVRQALALVLSRHEALRTRFETVDGLPRQVVGAVTAPAVPFLHCPAEISPGAFVRAALTHLEQAPFDLRRGPLIRCLEIRTPHGERVLAVAAHHLVFDGSSIPVFRRDLLRACEARRLGGDPAWTPLELQPADVAAHERRTLAGALLTSRLDYWRAQLAAPDVPLSVGGARAAAQPSELGASRAFWFGRELRDGIDSLAKGRRTTVFCTLLAATAAGLSRLTGQDRIRIACAVANRSHEALDSVIGLFVDLLVMTVETPGGKSYAALVADLQRSLADGVEYALPVELLLRELRPPRRHGRPFWFQVVATMLTEGTDPPSEISQKAAVEDPSPVVVHHDLAISFRDTGANLGIVVQYDLGLYDHDTIRNLVDVLGRTLGAAIGDPETPLARLPLSAASDFARARRGGVRAAEPTPVMVVDAVWRAAVLHPAAEAVRFGDTSLIYKDMCAQADALASRLIPLLTTTRRVAVRLDRSIGSVVAMLGVLRARGTYLPIPVNYPAGRWAMILADAQPDVVIVGGAAPPGVPPSTQVLDLDRPFDGGSSSPLFLPPRIDPTDPAYLIYTSGTTGRPKGVVIPHRGLNACVSAMPPALGTARRRVLQFSSLGFDASIFEHFLALAFGGTLCVPPPGESLPGLGLEGFIARAGVTDLVVAPSVMDSLADLTDTGLQRIVLGGERVTQAQADRLADRFEVHNAYGPTEISVWCTATRLKKGRMVDLGTAVAGASVHVLDEWLRPVPPGVLGEICVGGLGVADGYLGLARLTAERFVPDPFGPHPGARLYRTGDVGRLSPNGRVQYVGRHDQQVKVNGVRIELAEVEAVLARAPGVVACSVQVRPAADLGHRLVAYVVWKEGGQLNIPSLLDTLQRELPPAMVPRTFCQLPKLPLTSNGKLDAALLPDPAASSPADVFQPPLGPIEELVAGIWSDLLGVKRVERRSDFFQEGGNSLSAARLASRVSIALGLDVPIDLVLRIPVLSDFVGALASDRPVGSDVEITPVQRGRRTPLTAAQRALWIARHRQEGGNTIFFAIPILGSWSEAVVRQAVAAVHARHETLRTWFGEEHGRAFQDISAEAPVPFEVAVLPEDAAERTVAMAAIAERLAATPLEPSRAPLYFTVLAARPGEPGRLFVAIHHLIADGWSVGIYAHEVRAACAAFHEGKPFPFPSLPIQYGDYALWEQRPGAVTESDLARWDGLLEGCASEFPLPFVQSARGPSGSGVIPVRLDRATTLAVTRRARAEGATPFMALAAALGLVLQRRCATNDVVLCSDVAVRPHPVLESLIGLFLNQLLIRLTLPESGAPEAAIATARAACLASYRGRQVPLERIVARLSERRRTSMARCARVKLDLQPFDAAGDDDSDYPMGLTAPDLPLTFFLALGEAGLHGTLVFDRSLIDEATAASLVAEFEDALRDLGSLPIERSPLDR